MGLYSNHILSPRSLCTLRERRHHGPPRMQAHETAVEEEGGVAVEEAGGGAATNPLAHLSHGQTTTVASRR